MKEKKELVYNVKGIYTTPGGQDDDGVCSVRETFSATSEKEARNKFAEIIENTKKACMFFRSDESAVDSVHLKLLHGKKKIASVDLRQEKTIRSERSVIKQGRGWIDQKNWIHGSNKKHLKKGMVYNSVYSTC